MPSDLSAPAGSGGKRMARLVCSKNSAAIRLRAITLINRL